MRTDHLCDIDHTAIGGMLDDVELRDAVMPADVHRAEPAKPPGREPPGRELPVTSVRTRVDGRFTALKVTATVVVVIIAVLPGDPLRMALSGVAALLLAGYALRDLIAPARLAADAEAVTIITGYARRTRLPWSAIERAQVRRRTHLGLRSEFLELETGDSLHLLSQYDLGMPPSEVAARLSHLSGGLPPVESETGSHREIGHDAGPDLGTPEL